MRLSIILAILIQLYCSLLVGASENFIGASDVYLDRAEAARREIAVFWTGKELPKWSEPCTMSVKIIPDTRDVKRTAGGSVSFGFVNGEVVGWSMRIEGPHGKLLDSGIPHEVAHMVHATLLRRPFQRWLDEGMAEMWEHPTRHYKYRAMSKQALNHPYQAFRMLDSGEYPPSANDAGFAMYPTSFTLVEWLLEQKGKATLLEFARDNRPPSKKFKAFYGVSPAEAEAKWRTWIARRPNRCSEAGCLMHTTAKPLVAAAENGKPTLYVFSGAFCLPCERFKFDYRMDKAFARQLNAAFNVQIIELSDNRELGRKYGVTVVPTFRATSMKSNIVGYELINGKSKLLAQLLPKKGGDQDLTIVAVPDEVLNPPKEAKPEKFEREPEKAKPAEAEIDWSLVKLVFLRRADDVSGIRAVVRKKALQALDGLGPIRRKVSEISDGKADFEAVFQRTRPERFKAIQAAANVEIEPRYLLLMLKKQDLGLLKGKLLAIVEAKIAPLLEKAPIGIVTERNHRDDFQAIAAALKVAEPGQPEVSATDEPGEPEKGDDMPWYYGLAALVETARRGREKLSGLFSGRLAA